MKTVVIDPEHGGRGKGAMDQESRLNLMLSLKVREKLLDRYRVKVLMTRTENRFMNEKTRARFVNRHHGHFLCMIHHNDQNQFETYRFNGKVHPLTIKRQKLIHEYIMENLFPCEIVNGGNKQTDSEILRRTKTSAVILSFPIGECQNRDGPDCLRETASVIADALARAIKLPHVGKPLYHVIAGSFLNQRKAKERVKFLEQQQIDTIINETSIEGKTYFRVHAGVFRNRRFAEKRVNELNKMRLGDVFITAGNAPLESGSSQAQILGTPRFHGEEMDKYAHYLNPDSPQLGQYYEDFGRHYGVRGDIAFAQALYETRHFRFTNITNPEQHNYCRLGVNAENPTGDSFKNPQSGVLAHIQHLYALASKEPLPEGFPLADRHFLSFDRGHYQTWMDLNWRGPDREEEYGQLILNEFEQMSEFLNKKKRRFPLLKKLLRFIKL